MGGKAMITKDSTVSELLDHIADAKKINQLTVIYEALIPQIWAKHMRDNNIKAMESLILEDYLMDENYIIEFFDYVMAKNIDTNYLAHVAEMIIPRYVTVYNCLMPFIYINLKRHFRSTVVNVGARGNAAQCRQLKIYILENFSSDYIDQFISAMPNRNKNLLKSNGHYYTIDDFWGDIPEEYKLGVII